MDKAQKDRLPHRLPSATVFLHSGVRHKSTSSARTQVITSSGVAATLFSDWLDGWLQASLDGVAGNTNDRQEVEVIFEQSVQEN